MSQDPVGWFESAFAHPVFAALKRQGAPFLILELEPLRAVWINAGAAALFGTDRIEAISTRFLVPESPLGQTLEELADHLKPGSGPRLRRLRVFMGAASPNLTLLCHRLPDMADVPRLALAIAGQGSIRSSVASHSQHRGQLTLPTEGSNSADGHAMRTQTSSPVLEHEAPNAPPESAVFQKLVETERARLRDTFGGVNVRRFLWRTDALGHVVHIESGVFEDLEAVVLPLLRRSLAGSVAEFAPDEAETINKALADRKAWSRIRVLWPIARGRVAVPVTLSGSPQYESGRAFAGFRGFGLIDLAQPVGIPERSVAGNPLSNVRSEEAPGDVGRTMGLAEPANEEAGQDDRQTVTSVSPRPVNVVRLRPLQSYAAEPGATRPRTAGPPSERDQAPGEELESSADVQSSADDSCAVLGADRNGSLSSSEHFAFQEIARRLGATSPGSGRNDDASGPSDTDQVNPDTAEPGPQTGSEMREPARHSSLTLRALLDAAGDAIAALDDAGRVLALNQQGERWFRGDRRRLAGESFTLLLAPESRALAASLFAQVAGSPEASAEASQDLVARTPEGASIPLQMSLKRIEGGLFAAVWRDLSATRYLESGLSRAQADAQRARGQQAEFLAKVSHEIRTPLNAILGFAEIMMDERMGSLGNSRYRDYLQDIHASGTRVMNIVSDLLDLSRIEAGRLDLQPGSVDLNKAIGDCVARIQPQAHRERVIVRTSLGARLPAVMVDGRSLGQIVTNLLSNAVGFNEPGGQVIVSTALSDTGTVVLRIRDTGVGMSDAEIAAALEPFRQLGPVKQKPGSTGLGLPLTKALAEANGASLSIRSRPGEGTLVEVTFTPAVAPAARVPA